MANPQLDQLAINTMRALAMDAVQQADSGHPGTPMAMAPVAYCLWQRFLRFDPEDPIWPNRDRFVLSAGHASMLLYSLLYLTGVKAVNPQYERFGTPSVTLDDIKHYGWNVTRVGDANDLDMLERAFRVFGFTVDHVVAAAQAQIARARAAAGH